MDLFTTVSGIMIPGTVGEFIKRKPMGINMSEIGNKIGNTDLAERNPLLLFIKVILHRIKKKVLVFLLKMEFATK